MSLSFKSKDNRYQIVLWPAALVILIDQITKSWTLTAIPEFNAVSVIPGFFDLVHLRNRGAAFGLLNRSDIEWQFWLFLFATLAAVGIIFSLVRSARSNEKYLFAGLGLVLGGSIGNLIDRLRFRAVVDFLDFYIGEWHWPAFNVADIAICCGAFLVCFAMCKARQ